MKDLIFIILLTPFIFFSCKKNTKDTTPPVITLIGSAAVDVNTSTSYTDVGATAKDDVDGDNTSSIVVNNSVNTNVNNTYYVTYNVKDKAGNAATEVKRKVVVFNF